MPPSPSFRRSWTPPRILQPADDGTLARRGSAARSGGLTMAYDISSARRGVALRGLALTHELRFCPRCGAPTQPEHRFCTGCGGALGAPSAPPAAQAAAQAPPPPPPKASKALGGCLV